MKDDFVNQVLEILGCVGDGGEEALKANADKIHALADYSRKTAIFIQSKDLGTEALKDLSPIEIYTHMIIKIIESPTSIHRDASVLCIIPHLSDALKE